MDYPKDYIGDGVYALFDGMGVWLHANDHINPTDKIYLERITLESLINFVKRCDEWKAKEKQKNLRNNP